MRRGSIFVILFALVAAVVVGASQFFRAQPALEIRIAVDPLIADWAGAVIRDLNATQPLINSTRRIQFVTVVIDDPDVWGGRANWTPTNHPAAWIPAAALSVGYAGSEGLPFTTQIDSLARTPLVWGGYPSRVTVLTENGAQPFDFAAVRVAAEAGSWSGLGGQSAWGFVDLGLQQPSRKMGGLAVLLTGAADLVENPQLTSADLSGNFRTVAAGLLNSVVNFNTLGADPARTMASSYDSTVEIALLPESLWLNNLAGLVRHEQGFVFSYPAYQFVLTFPFARWTPDINTALEVGPALDLLQDWLTRADQQARLTGFGLRPAASEPTVTDETFSLAMPYGIALTPNYGQAVTPPSRGDVQGLVEWAAQQ
jgi:hypothetical protein